MEFDRDAIEQLIGRVDTAIKEIDSEWRTLKQQLKMIEIIKEQQFYNLPFLLNFEFKVSDEHEKKLQMDSLEGRCRALEKEKEKLSQLLG